MDRMLLILIIRETKPNSPGTENPIICSALSHCLSGISAWNTSRSITRSNRAGIRVRSRVMLSNMISVILAVLLLREVVIKEFISMKAGLSIGAGQKL